MCIDSQHSDKYENELSYWQKRYSIEGNKLWNNWYKADMLGLANETNQDFIIDKVVADFGCGPRGSLCWATKAKERIGIDVLTDEYENLRSKPHNMRYVKSSEKEIPLPKASIDIIYTINSLDHVFDLPTMCKEITRVLRRGGLLLGSFNLNEPITPCEPQTLNFETLREHLLGDYFVQTRKIEKKEKKDLLKVRAIKS